MSRLTMTDGGALLRQRSNGAPTGPGTPVLDGVMGESRAIRSTLDYVRSLAMQDTQNVLLVGAPGTGKALFARALHNAGPKAHLPFLSLDCSAANGSFLETELFGYEPGAYEGVTMRKRGLLELAAGGTVLLENVESLPARLQPKLMHALAKRRARRVGGRDPFAVKATIIAATARPLEVLVVEGVFREDLFFELNAPRISVPSLAERDEDVVLLAQRFLDETAREQGLRPMALTVDAHSALLAYDWPGNVRELRGVIRKAAERCDGSDVRPEHLDIESTVGSARSRTHGRDNPNSGRSMREIERAAFFETLQRTHGDSVNAARILDVPHDHFLERVRDLGLDGLVAAVVQS